MEELRIKCQLRNGVSGKHGRGRAATGRSLNAVLSRSIDNTDGAGAASKKKAESICFPAFLTIAS